MSSDPYIAIHNNLQRDKELIDPVAFQFRKTVHIKTRQPLLSLLFSYLSIDRQLSRSITITITCTLISVTNIPNCCLCIIIGLWGMLRDIFARTDDWNVYKKPIFNKKMGKEYIRSCNREHEISSCFNCKCSCLCKHTGSGVYWRYMYRSIRDGALVWWI